MVDLAGGLLATKPTAEAQPTGARARMKRKEATSMSSEADDYHDHELKKKEASPSEDDATALKKEGDSLFKEGEMLKMREELWEAERLWREKLVPGGVGSLVEEEEDHAELSDEEMAKCPKEYRQMYAINKVINAKNLAY
ncbi:unnamed protein product [Miscanthus lutarioriparius]|uniref:Uncharacterized protein n=1 Tax=Miscanthus lutarioriparius TaxID=422564 RepID=A0A811REG2_9POAL|nr:unnamed protein product [Miscanthus lutarioriparius]